MPEKGRLEEVTTRLVEVLHATIQELRITEDELWQAIEFLAEVGKKDEFALLFDVLGISILVDGITHDTDTGATASNVWGPFHRQGAPLLTPPYVLAGPDEPGEPLVVSGVVTDAVSGDPIQGMLDIWQADANGHYSNEDASLDSYHLRGRMPVGGDGSYEFRTVVPPPYEIPKDGPVGRLLRALGRHAFRPAHLHMHVTCEGYTPLTTMMFFSGDPYLGSDTIDAVKDSLVVVLERRESPNELEAHGLDRPFNACTFDIALRPRSQMRS